MLTIETKKLESALKILKPLAGQRHQIPILGCVLIEKGSMHATDMDASCKILNIADPLHPPMVIEFIKAEAAVKPAKLLKQSQVTLSQSEFSPNDFPVFPKRPDKEKPARADFTPEDMRFALAAVPNDPVRYYLNGVCIDTNANALVGTDGHRLHRAGLSSSKLNPAGRFILPAAACEFLIKHGENAITLDLYQNQAWHEAQGFVYVTKLVDGTYPDYQRVIPANNNTTLEFPEGVTDLCKIAKLNAKAEKKKIPTIDIGPLYLNADYLLSALSYFEQIPCVRIDIEDKDVLGNLRSPILIESKRKTAVIMPMKKMV